MRRRVGCLLALAYPVVEVALAVLLAQWVGWWWLLVYVVVCVVVGLGLVRYSLGATGRSWGVAIATLRGPGLSEQTRAVAIEGQAGRESTPPAQTLLIVPAGLLIALPGILTTLIGLILWLPMVRGRIAERIGRAARRLEQPGWGGSADPQGPF